MDEKNFSMLIGQLLADAKAWPLAIAATLSVP